jgi:hypothetical protein
MLLLGMLVPVDYAQADANAPTETHTPSPTETSPPQPTDIPLATDTPIQFPTSTISGGPDGEAAFATPLPMPPSGGFSTVDRILLMLLAVVVVIVIGVIVYLVYYRSRGSLDDR